MSVSAISPASVQANPTQVNQQVQADKNASPVQADQTAQKAAKTAQTDTVTISKQAVQMVNDGDSSAQEAKESAAEKASEQLKGKK